MSPLTFIKEAREFVKKHDYSKARLQEAIPYINKFSGQQFVLKIGGSILSDFTLLPHLIEDVIFLKKVGINVILVHGGSRQLNEEMNKRALHVKYIDGLRQTSADVLNLAAEVFSEISNKIKEEIEKHGYKCVIFDRDSGLIQSKPKNPSLQLGYVGTPCAVNTSFLINLSDDVLPIVSAVTAGTKAGDIGFNVNADDVAGIIASKIKAEKLILMTDVEGVLDERGQLLPSLTINQAKQLMSKKIIKDGMVPKVMTCLNALELGVHKCHIIKGGVHTFIDEILTDEGVGTEFIKDVQLLATATGGKNA